MDQHRVRAPGEPWGAWRPLAVVVLATLFLRLPSLWEPHHYTDEGIFAAVAQRLLHGHALYADAWDDKPPLVYVVYAAVLALFGPSMFALRVVATLWAAATTVAVTLIGQRLLGRRWGVAAGLVCALVLASPLVEGNLALTELFASAPVAWAFVLLTTEDEAELSRRHLGVAGSLLACGFLFKQVAALEAAAAGIALLMWGVRRELLYLVGGFAVPCAVAAGALALIGAAGEAWFAVFGFYEVYLREGSGLPALFAVVRLLPATTALVVATVRRRDAGAVLACLWLGFAATGAALAARPFGHYAVQVVPSLSLGIVIVVQRMGDAFAARRYADGPCVTSRAPSGNDVGSGGAAPPAPWVRRLVEGRVTAAPVAGPAAVVVAAVFTLYVAFSGFWLSYPAVEPRYYANWAAYVTGRRDRYDFERFFSWRVDNQRRLAALIAPDAERTLFVWGEYPWLYPLADAANPTRFPTSYHTSYVPGAKDEVMDALRAHPPRYVVWEREEWRRLPGLATFLAERYERVAVVDNSELYRRVEDRLPGPPTRPGKAGMLGGERTGQQQGRDPCRAIWPDAALRRCGRVVGPRVGARRP